MSKASVAWAVLIGLMLIATGASALRYLVNRDYLVIANVPCDPTAYSCFIGDGEDTPESYLTIVKPAYAIPACNGWNDECPFLSCEPGEKECERIECDAEAGDECVVPVLEEPAPMEEEASEEPVPAEE